MSYLANKQKEITLPSGATVTVRRQTKYELILIGSPPAWFVRNANIRDRASRTLDAAQREALLATIPETTDTEMQEWIKYLAKQNGVLLSRCCVSPLAKGGEQLRIVNKEPGDTAPGEISWALVDEADQEAILRGINELDDQTGREAVGTFPETPQGATGAQGDRRTGATVSPEPAGTAGDVAAGVSANRHGP